LLSFYSIYTVLKTVYCVFLLFKCILSQYVNELFS
jgi:hypothetical protein